MDQDGKRALLLKMREVSKEPMTSRIAWRDSLEPAERQFVSGVVSQEAAVWGALLPLIKEGTNE